MVQLEEVEDDAFLADPTNPTEDDNDWDTDSAAAFDSESDALSDVSSDVEDESLADRLAALRDMIPPTQRRYISSTVSTASSWVRSGLQMGGKGLWLVSTSVMLLGVPWALAYAEEQQMAEMEKEMQAQKMASEMLTPGAPIQEQEKPAL